MNAAAHPNQFDDLSRFARRRLPSEGEPHRNISARVFDIRDDGPAFGCAPEAPAAQSAPAPAAASAEAEAESPAAAPVAPPSSAGWAVRFLLSFLLSCALTATGWYAWTLQEKIALLETTIAALATEAQTSSEVPDLLRLNPELAAGNP